MYRGSTFYSVDSYSQQSTIVAASLSQQNKYQCADPLLKLSPVTKYWGGPLHDLYSMLPATTVVTLAVAIILLSSLVPTRNKVITTRFISHLTKQTRLSLAFNSIPFNTCQKSIRHGNRCRHGWLTGIQHFQKSMGLWPSL